MAELRKKSDSANISQKTDCGSHLGDQVITNAKIFPPWWIPEFLLVFEEESGRLHVNRKENLWNEMLCLLHVHSSNGLNYLEMRLWIGIWTGVFLIIMVAFDLSALVRYITRFTEESFAALISLIFIVEAVVKLIRISVDYPINLQPGTVLNYNCSCDLTNVTLSPNISADSIGKENCTNFNGTLIGGGCDTPIYYPDIFFFSVLLFLGTFTMSYSLKIFRNAPLFPTSVSVHRAVMFLTELVIFLVTLSALLLVSECRTLGKARKYVTVTECIWYCAWG